MIPNGLKCIKNYLQRMYQILSIRVALIKKDKSYCDHESVQIPPPFLTLLTLVNFFTIYLEKKLSLFFFSGKTGSQIRTFFVLKPFRDQDRANKKSLAKSVQPFQRRQATSKHTHTQATIVFLYNRDIQYIQVSTI